MMRKVFVFALLAWLAFAPAVFNPAALAASQAGRPESPTNNAKTLPASASPQVGSAAVLGDEDGPGISAQAGDVPLALLAQPAQPHTIYLKSREFVPGVADEAALDRLASPSAGRVHLLVQLDYIPRQLAKEALAAQGLSLLAYVPDYAWIASFSSAGTSTVLDLPGVTWAGALLPEDKLDPAIQAGVWSDFNLSEEGTAAVYVAFHKDEDLNKGHELVAGYGGKVTGVVNGINLLMVEMPLAQVQSLAWEDSVQWIEPAAPPLTEANDGIRPQIGADTVNAIPFSLTGAGIDVLVYDGGQVGDHPDFGARLIHGDTADVSDHSTHVAGTLGGSGSLSASAGGAANQWRGMAPGVDIISYGAYLTYDYIFYNDVGDIEANWAAAQNTYGADLGTASLGMNIYQNYPTRCDLMGNYGATEVLMDQIVRGGNSTVGVGDRYIATWAAGNERGHTCGTYGTTAPPAGAKNPIQVGASNTNDSSMTTFSSWGPTDDGRIKPIVVAGGEQQGGDGGIKSTVPDLFINNTTRNCDGSGDDYCYPYDVMQGTSMATPAVAGGVALMLQEYRAVYNTSSNFYPSTAKVILIQTADDMGNPGPDYQWGYGQVNLPRAIELISRRAFRQDSLNAGAVDVYSLVVPTSSSPLLVSLAWDDFEATFNANPVLINNLDLELEAPSGTIWRPWVLNPASPSSNATRGVDSRNNQEQVQVPSPEVGTWIVRVSGTTVPQAPQTYSLACEGCKPLNLGVCQSQVLSLAAQDGLSSAEPLESAGNVESDAPETPVAAWTSLTLQTEGELWQRSLEAPDETATAAADLEAARLAGPQAVLDAAESMTGIELDMAEAEIRQAQQTLAEQVPPPPETTPPSEAQESANNDAIAAWDQAVWSQSLMQLSSPQDAGLEGEALQLPVAIESPNAPSLDRTVGNGCTYATIAAAIAAANPGDRLLIEGGRSFNENLTITGKNLTLQGGYTGCASASSARTTIDGSASGIVIRVTTLPTQTVTLSNLNITNGNGSQGGIRAEVDSGDLTLNNVDIYRNTSSITGGGLWVGTNVAVTGSGVNIYNNIAADYGGGVRLYGGSATFNSSTIHDNTAPIGAGVYGSREYSVSSALDLLSSADIYNNSALTGSGYGGGIYMRQGTVNVTDCSDLYSNDAIFGGGSYLITSTLTVSGACSEVHSNTATGDGGGVYAIASTVRLDNDAELYYNDAGVDGSGSGGGAYLNGSDLYSTKSLVHYNTAADFGGGIYAGNASIVNFSLGSFTCVGARCSRLSNNTATNQYGGGVYANGSDVSLANTFVESNTAYLGGGVYAYAAASQVSLSSSLFARNNASGGTGDGLRIYSSASLSGSGNTLAYNEAGGAATGRAIDLASASGSLSCSVIWGHANISMPGMSITYSDVQYGFTGAGNINQDPLFVAPASQDYHLQATSPAIDRCLSASTWDYDGELRPSVRISAASPYDMGADEVSGAARVGVDNTCAYSTIQQAVNAASSGATVRVSGGLYFENVDISGKSLTIRGGYDATCANPVGAATRVEGSLSSGSVFDIMGGTQTLQDLAIAWGSGTGAGLDVDGNAQVTLDNTKLTLNHGEYGGGVWINTGSTVTAINGSILNDNTASASGGGARVWGAFNAIGNAMGVAWNCAAHGGGFSIAQGQVTLDTFHVMGNLAADPSGRGGGALLEQGAAITLNNNTYFGDLGYYGNSAYDGGALYADASRINLNNSLATLSNNTASHYGGGVYLANSSTLTGVDARIGSNWAATTGNDAVYGAGVYAVNSNIDYAGRFFNNIATAAGGALYANNSVVHLTGAQVGGTETNLPNQLSASGSYGAGLYLTSGTKAELQDTRIINNLFNTSGVAHGGGVYLYDTSAITMTNSTVQGHIAPSASVGRGAGVYVDASRITLDHSQVISNTAGMNGGGLRLWGTSTLNVRNDSEIRGNQANTGDGGGVAATGTTTINFNNISMQHNQAATNGGGVSVDGGTLSINGWFDVRFNHAGANGGAVAITGTADPSFHASVTNSHLSVNTAGGNGGAIYLGNNSYAELYSTAGILLNMNTNHAAGSGGAAFADAGGTFDYYGNVVATSNTADGNGGVFYLSNASHLWIDDYGYTRPQIWVNTADNGGAVYAIGSSTVQCDGGDLGYPSNGNRAAAGSGGAVYLDGSSLDASNCVFRNNQASADGGAIAALHSSNLSIYAEFATAVAAGEEEVRLSPQAPQATGCDPVLQECSSIYGNLADSDNTGGGDGGGIFSSGSTATVNHTYFHDNQAQRGGGICQVGAAASTTVSNSLIAGNTTILAFGSGIRTDAGSLFLQHNTIADNGGGAGVSLGGGTCEARNNILWGNSSAGFTAAPSVRVCNIDQSGLGGIVANPLFVGGGDYHLHPVSPAVNACSSGLSPDLDGVARPFGVNYDMGAFEYAMRVLFAPLLNKP